MPAARSLAVDHLIEAGSGEAALLVALTGNDELLMNRVVASEAGSPLLRATTRAWRGSPSDVQEFEELVRSNPRQPLAIRLAWLRSALACDVAGVSRWADVHRVQFGLTPFAPVDVGEVPDLEGALRPPLYPEATWRVTLPSRPYVIGTWLYVLGEPSCR